MPNHHHHDSGGTITDLHLSASPAQDIIPTFASERVIGGNFRTTKYPKNPRKKRTKLIRIDNQIGVSSDSTCSVDTAKPKHGKKPNPCAPNITRPCSECGKRFWSWKALFGHMRCHPERQWRGINPPPNLRRWPLTSEIHGSNAAEPVMTEKDHEIAACLLMLANAPSHLETHGDLSLSETDTVVRDAAASCGEVDAAAGPPGGLHCRFECSSCKKVFGSHQALGGHRASHRNVKGCFAIKRSDSEEVDHINGGDLEDRNGGGEVMMMDPNISDIDKERELYRTNCNLEGKMMLDLGHKCNVCLRVFSSGQALGGHKRCHWEKGDESPSSLAQGLNINPFSTRNGCGLDLNLNLNLNLPAPVEDDLLCSYSSGLALDLRLGL